MTWEKVLPTNNFWSLTRKSRLDLISPLTFRHAETRNSSQKIFSWEGNRSLLVFGVLLLFRVFNLTSIQFHQLLFLPRNTTSTVHAATKEQIKPQSSSKRWRTILICKMSFWRKLCIDLTILTSSCWNHKQFSSFSSRFPSFLSHPVLLQLLVFDSWLAGVKLNWFHNVCEINTKVFPKQDLTHLSSVSSYWNYSCF